MISEFGSGRCFVACLPACPSRRGLTHCPWRPSRLLRRFARHTILRIASICSCLNFIPHSRPTRLQGSGRDHVHLLWRYCLTSSACLYSPCLAPSLQSGQLTFQLLRLQRAFADVRNIRQIPRPSSIHLLPDRLRRPQPDSTGDIPRCRVVRPRTCRDCRLGRTEENGRNVEARARDAPEEGGWVGGVLRREGEERCVSGLWFSLFDWLSIASGHRD